ncbi:1837_t:CDS:2, partial [Diversispora eburnea]
MEVDLIPENIQDKVKLSIPSKKIQGQGYTSDLLAKIEELKDELRDGQDKLKEELRSEQDELKEELRSGQEELKSNMESGFKTETEKGKEVLEKGYQIDFPLKVTTITKSGEPGRFMSSPTDEDTHRSPILGTRKPDFVFILKDSKLDYLNVVAIGEIKKPISGKFSDAQIGQAISFGEKLLQLQPRR